MSLEVFGVILAVLALPAAAYGLYQLLLDFPGITEGWFPSQRRTATKGYRVRSTVIKALIGAEETEVIKLRRVRVYRAQTLLEHLDYVPEVYDPTRPGEDRPAKIRGLYSIPGTAQDTDENRIFVSVSEDEEPFLPLRDHNVVVGYILTEKIKDLWEPEPPQLMARAPVGWERLVIEVHLPPGLRFKRIQNSDTAKAKLFKKEENAVPSELQLKRPIRPHIRDFKDGLGPVEWIRAVIPKPPKNGNTDIILEWEWEQKINTPPVAKTPT